MFCPECGNQNPDTAKFCIRCGYQFSENLNPQASNYYPFRGGQNSYSNSYSTVQAHNIQKPQYSGKKSSVGTTIAVLIGVLAITAGIIAFVAYQQQHPSRSNNYSSSSSSTEIYSSQPPVAQINRGNTILGDKAFTVGPGKYQYVKFTIEENWKNAVVVGSFRASGGEGNDVRVFITDAKGFTNIINGHSGNVWYDSGKVTTDDINVNLGPGTYFLVFSNSFSIISNKAVNSDVQLQYEY